MAPNTDHTSTRRTSQPSTHADDEESVPFLGDTNIITQQPTGTNISSHTPASSPLARTIETLDAADPDQDDRWGDAPPCHRDPTVCLGFAVLCSAPLMPCSACQYGCMIAGREKVSYALDRTAEEARGYWTRHGPSFMSVMPARSLKWLEGRLGEAYARTLECVQG